MGLRRLGAVQLSIQSSAGEGKLVMRRTLRPVAATCLWLTAVVGAGGCQESARGPVVFYLDGAGWYSSAGSAKQGLRDAGYTGDFRTFSWSAYLGPAHDHFVTSRSKSVARGLARQIERVRKNDPTGLVVLMGLSAGTAVILSALDQLPEGVWVDSVVLFSPSVSARHDLTPVMKHVRGILYATCSPHDGVLRALVSNADGKRGPPAGRTGFRMPRGKNGTKEAYRRVVNLHWRPAYLAFDWNGGHTTVTRSRFVAGVIAPRIFSSAPFPLDRSVADAAKARRTGESS